jgi:predicted peptidase
MLLTWARIAAIYTLVSLSPAQTSGGRAEVKLFEATLPHTTRIQYLLQLPGEYYARRDRAWPLLVYLHGASGRGSDLELVKRYGPPATAGKVNAFVLISPQCPEGEIWTDTEGLIAMIASVQKQYRIDPRRIYLTGISMGGRGVLYLAYKHPATFAAVASLAPYAPITAWGEGLASTPLLLLHGDKDAAAPIEDSKELVASITKAGGTVEFRPLPGRDHYIADLYGKGDIYDWLLNHQR